MTRRHQNYSIVKNKQQAESSKRAKRSRKKHLLPGGLFLADGQPEPVFARKKPKKRSNVTEKTGETAKKGRKVRDVKGTRSEQLQDKAFHSSISSHENAEKSGMEMNYG